MSTEFSSFVVSNRNFGFKTIFLPKVVAPSAANGDFDFLTAPPTQQRMVGMEECPLHLRKGCNVLNDAN